ALHRRPLAIGPYPVATELAALGFGWFSARDAGAVAGWLDRPARGLLDRNRALAVRHFSLADLPAKVAQVLEGCRGVGPRE
ncbi:MAG TPA: hypothetical protein VE152_10820, partial [Acidimicrobiales bacterium]|nr:hypothetical protein [Acidimicrobiales bacterium]